MSKPVSPLRTLNEPDIEALLRRAMDTKATASLRAGGSAWMLGQLRVLDLQPGAAIHLLGAKRRDQLPPEGTPVTLSLLLGDAAIALQTLMLKPLEQQQDAPLLRTAWPTQALEIGQREQVRVAYSALRPLGATLRHQGQSLEAKLLNLTETGMGLGLAVPVSFKAQDRVEVETCFPGGEPFRVTGEVRHCEFLAGDPMPTRMGLILVDLPPEIRGSLHRLIQARRMYYSQNLRDKES